MLALLLAYGYGKPTQAFEHRLGPSLAELIVGATAGDPDGREFNVDELESAATPH